MASKPKLKIVATGKATGKRKYVPGKPWHPTPLERRTVQRCMAIGFTVEQCADVLGVTRSSVQKHCRKELDAGASIVGAKVGGKLIRKALAGDTQALIFYAKCRLGWNEKQLFEHSGRGGGPIVYDALANDAAAFTERMIALGQRYLEGSAKTVGTTPLEALPAPPPDSEIN